MYPDTIFLYTTAQAHVHVLYTSCDIYMYMYRIHVRGIFHETIISTLKILRDFTCNLTKSALQ